MQPAGGGQQPPHGWLGVPGQQGQQSSSANSLNSQQGSQWQAMQPQQGSAGALAGQLQQQQQQSPALLPGSGQPAYQQQQQQFQLQQQQARAQPPNLAARPTQLQQPGGGLQIPPRQQNWASASLQQQQLQKPVALQQQPQVHTTAFSSSQISQAAAQAAAVLKHQQQSQLQAQGAQLGQQQKQQQLLHQQQKNEVVAMAQSATQAAAQYQQQLQQQQMRLQQQRQLQQQQQQQQLLQQQQMQLYHRQQGQQPQGAVAGASAAAPNQQKGVAAAAGAVQPQPAAPQPQPQLQRASQPLAMIQQHELEQRRQQILQILQSSMKAGHLSEAQAAQVQAAVVAGNLSPQLQALIQQLKQLQAQPQAGQQLGVASPSQNLKGAFLASSGVPSAPQSDVQTHSRPKLAATSSATGQAPKSATPHPGAMAAGTTPVSASAQPAPAQASAGAQQPTAAAAPAQTEQSRGMGFSPEQLNCLRNQILAFKRIKRGDATLPPEVRLAITPSPLRPLQQTQSKGAAKAAAQKPATTKSAAKAVTTAKSPPPRPATPTLTPKQQRENAVQAHRPLSRFSAPLITFQGTTPSLGSLGPYGVLQASMPGGLQEVSFSPSAAEILRQELDRHVTDGREQRMKELEQKLQAAETRATEGSLRHVSEEIRRNGTGLPDKGRCMLQIRMLRLVQRQAALRREVEQAQQDLLSMNERSYRKHLKTMDKQSYDMGRHADKAKSEKASVLIKACRAFKSDMLDRVSTQKELRIARVRGISRLHDRFLRSHNKVKEDDRTRRMEALQANDLAAYQELIRQQSGGAGQGTSDDAWNEISKFLLETEAYLEKLGSKLASVKVTQEAQDAAETAAAEARAAGCSEEEAKAIGEAAAREAKENSRVVKQANKSIGDAQSRYYSLAHSIEEKVLSKPSLLVPPNGGALREYQMLGLSWMVSLYNNHLNGILADEMGLGKTVQVMALIAYLMEFKANNGPHLIIVPNAVLVNWKSELQTWLPSVRCVYYVGHKDERARKFVQEVSPMQFNILVTTYEFIMRDRSKLSKVEWKYIIIDEAQRMKDRSSKLAKDLDRYIAARRLLLTGTPLQNELAELWSLLNLLLPEVFDDNKGFTEWFSDSIASGEQSEEANWLEKEKRVVVIHRLHQILEPFMLRRQVSDVETKLPPKVVYTIKCAMTQYQNSIYDWVKTTGTVRIDPMARQGKIAREYAPLNNRVMELRKVCNHPLLTYPPFPVLDPIDTVRTCGKMMTLDRMLVKLFHTPHRVLLFSTMTKFLDLMESYLRWRLVDGPNGKQHMKYSRIDGSTTLEDREASIQEFRKPDSETFIFLLSIRAAGRGLNLQTSDTVIIYDPDHNPKNEEQAIARAHRIGQTKEVRVFFLESVPEVGDVALNFDSPGDIGASCSTGPGSEKKKYADSIESLIRNTIQKMKIDMANEVIDAGRFDGQTTNEERKQSLEEMLADADRNNKATNEIPTHSELNQMLARSPDEIALFDRLDQELEWPALEGIEGTPPWLRYTPEQRDLVARENRPSAFGLDARAERAAIKQREVAAANAMGSRRGAAGSWRQLTTGRDARDDTLGKEDDDDDDDKAWRAIDEEDEPGAADSRGHTWDSPGIDDDSGLDAHVEDGPEMASKVQAPQRPSSSLSYQHLPLRQPHQPSPSLLSGGSHQRQGSRETGTEEDGEALGSSIPDKSAEAGPDPDKKSKKRSRGDKEKKEKKEKKEHKDKSHKHEKKAKRHKEKHGNASPSLAQARGSAAAGASATFKVKFGGSMLSKPSASK